MLYIILEMKKIIVLGAGFAGLSCAKILSRYFPSQVVLIDKNNYHLYTPLLCELNEERVRLPIKIRAEFIQKEVLDWRRLDCDYLVLATGAETNYYDIPGLKENAITFKNLEDLRRLQNVPSGSILIIGGGANGVELAMKLAQKLQGENIKIIEGKDCILSNIDASLRMKAEQLLKKWGVEILTGHHLERVEASQLFFKNGESVNFNNLIWTGGVRTGEYKVDEYLRVLGEKNVFAVGDCASINPGLASLALEQAKIAAINIKRTIENKQLLPYRPKPNSIVIPLGDYYAIAQIGRIKIAGLLAWLIKKIINYLYIKTYDR